MPVDKSGRVYVVGSVPVLHPEAQTVDEMLEGWRNQQLCRNLDHDTIAGRTRLVQRFIEHTNEFPWTWTPSMVEEFFSDLRSVKGRKHAGGWQLMVGSAFVGGGFRRRGRVRKELSVVNKLA